MRTLVSMVAPSRSACWMLMRISVPPTSASLATSPMVNVRMEPLAAIRSMVSPASAPRTDALVCPITTLPSLMGPEIRLPMTAPIASRGSAVMAMGNAQPGPLDCWTTVEPRCTRVSPALNPRPTTAGADAAAAAARAVARTDAVSGPVCAIDTASSKGMPGTAASVAVAAPSTNSRSAASPTSTWLKTTTTSRAATVERRWRCISDLLVPDGARP
jgi:hypothetical protein